MDLLMPKKLSFQDFVARDKTQMLAVSRTYESITEVVDRVNEWIESEGVEVSQVETLMLVGVPKSSGGTSTNEAVFNVGPFSAWHQVVRVWYTSRSSV
jgi:hypothetical protein